MKHMKTILELAQEAKEELIAKGICDQTGDILCLIRDDHRKYPESGLRRYLHGGNSDLDTTRDEIEEFYIKYDMRWKLLEDILGHRRLKVPRGEKGARKRGISFGNIHWFDIPKKYRIDHFFEYIMMFQIERILFENFNEEYMKHLSHYANDHNLMKNKYHETLLFFQNSYVFFHINRLFKPEYLAIDDVNKFMRHFYADHLERGFDDEPFSIGLDFIDKLVFKINSFSENGTFEKFMKMDFKDSQKYYRAMIINFKKAEEGPIKPMYNFPSFDVLVKKG